MRVSWLEIPSLIQVLGKQKRGEIASKDVSMPRKNANLPVETIES